MNSEKAIIYHISNFLDYCKEESLKKKTQENYTRFIARFLKWLENNNLDSLLPHQLTIDHINRYKEYLSSSSLKIITQNYYLIALRAFLSYFVAKDKFLYLLVKLPFLRPIKA